MTRPVQTAPIAAFKVDIRRLPGRKLGLVIDAPTKRVTTIRPGLMNDYNDLNPYQQVRPGDRIVAINSVTTSEQMLYELDNSEFLTYS